MTQNKLSAYLTGILLVASITTSILLWVEFGALMGIWALLQTAMVLMSLSAAGGAVMQALQATAEGPYQQRQHQPVDG
jgi:hypothetical protein